MAQNSQIQPIQFIRAQHELFRCLIWPAVWLKPSNILFIGRKKQQLNRFEWLEVRIFVILLDQTAIYFNFSLTNINIQRF